MLDTHMTSFDVFKIIKFNNFIFFISCNVLFADNDSI